MKVSSQLLLTFLLNACWQIALIAALSWLGSRLMRNSQARYGHWVWAGALCLAFLVPAVATSRAFFDSIAPAGFGSPTSQGDRLSPVFFAEARSLPTSQESSGSTFLLNQSLGLALLIIYLGFLIYRIIKLVQAWQTTSSIRRSAVDIGPNDLVADIMRRCESEFGSRRTRVFRSNSLAVPVTVGLVHPYIILPESLLREGDVDLLTSAIAHEFVHVVRRDYLFNLIYEVIFVPLSFHPAAALLRRRVKETRELCCDELVASRIVNAIAYARSLVSLAGSAPPLTRLSVTTTVGIADADILEARIMSLLKKTELNTRWRKLLLVIVSLLLLVPCAAAVAFAMRFDVASQDPVSAAQEREKEELKRKAQADLEMKEVRMRRLSDPLVREEMERKQRVELEMRAVMQAAMLRLARINMDQAIQIATSQVYGKVLLCSLDAKGWEEPGKLSKDGIVFYHVLIATEGEEGSTHVWVNAIDGTVIKTEKELPRKREPEGR